MIGLYLFTVLCDRTRVPCVWKLGVCDSCLEIQKYTTFAKKLTAVSNKYFHI